MQYKQCAFFDSLSSLRSDNTNGVLSMRTMITLCLDSGKSETFPIPQNVYAL